MAVYYILKLKTTDTGINKRYNKRVLHCHNSIVIAIIKHCKFCALISWWCLSHLFSSVIFKWLV